MDEKKAFDPFLWMLGIVIPFSVVGAIMIGLVVCLAQSDPPAPRAGNQIQAPQQDTKADQTSADILQRGTEAAPVVVKLFQTPAEQADAAQNAQKANDKSADWAMAWITGGLGIVAALQLWLFWRQLNIMRDSLRDTETAAKAAKDSVIAMQTSDERQLRAYLSFRISEFPDTVSADKLINFKFDLTNHGPTPATNMGFRAQIWLIPNPIPEDGGLPPIVGAWNEDRMTVFPVQKDVVPKMNCATGRSFTSDQLARLALNSHCLVLGLEIKYRDAFEKWHGTREYFAIVGQGGNREILTIPGGSWAT